MSNAFAKWAKQYIEAGYSPVPIMPGTKRPGITAHGEQRGIGRWQRMCDTPATEHELEYWSQEYVGAGIGLALGFNNVVAIDIDVAPGEIFDTLVELLPDSEWAKKGSKGFTAFFRTEERMAAQKFKLRLDEAGNLVTEESGIRPSAVLEILSYGNQTVIPPTVHPGTGKPYQWENDPLSMCPAPALPVLDADFPDQVKEALKPWGYIPRSQEHKAGEYNTEHGTVYSDLNRDALADLDTWVPHLDRVEFDDDHKGSGYRMRAVWRGGNSESSVRIDNEMIYDYGADEKISPIDLVVYMNDMTPAEAFVWLFDKVNWELIEAANQMSANWEAGQAERDAKAQREQEEWLAAQRRMEAVKLEQDRKLEAEQLEGKMDDVKGNDLVQSLMELHQRKIPDPGDLERILDRSTGLLRDLIEVALAASKTPSKAIAASSAIAMMAALFGRRWASPYDGGAGKTFANIYVFGTAPSGIGKTTTLNYLRDAYVEACKRAATPELETKYSQTFAQEQDQDGEDGGEMDHVPALLEAFTGVLYEKDVHAPATIQNRLLRHPHTVMVVDECSNFVRRVWSERGGDSSIGLQGAIKKLISAAGGIAHGTDYTSSVKNQSDVYTPGFSFMGFSTPKSLMDALPPAAFEDGTIGRFLWLDEPFYPKLRRPSPNIDLRERAIERMTSIIKTRVSNNMDTTFGGYGAPGIPIEPTTVTKTPAAEDMLWKAELAFHAEGERAYKAGREDNALWGRINEVGQRLALLHALGNDHQNPIITADDVDFGLRLATYSICRWSSQADVAAGRQITGAVETENLRRRAVAILAKSPNGSLTKSQLSKRIHLSSKATEDLLNDLRDSGIALVVPGIRAGSFTVSLTEGASDLSQ